AGVDQAGGGAADGRDRCVADGESLVEGLCLRDTEGGTGRQREGGGEDEQFLHGELLLDGEGSGGVRDGVHGQRDRRGLRHSHGGRFTAAWRLGRLNGRGGGVDRRDSEAVLSCGQPRVGRGQRGRVGDDAIRRGS